MPNNPLVSRVLHVNLDSGRSDVILLEGRELHIGGSGLAAALYEKYGKNDAPWDDPAQPLIFAIGPLTGAFPLMSKTVCGFRSPYTGQWAESHAGGRLSLSLRFSGYDALMVTGRAKTLSCLIVGSRTIELKDVHYLRGRGVFGAGRELRRFGRGSSGHRSILRIGPAGENKVAYACINVDSFRHFGRLGSGAVMGDKKLKGLVVLGDANLDLPSGKERDYARLFKEIFIGVTDTDMMKKYHDLGTPENLAPLNELRALPWRNLQATSDPGIVNVTGELFAEKHLMRKNACSGCPVGCIHIALLRQQFADDHEYVFKQVSYDYELIFAQGTMLGLTNAEDIMQLLDETESCGLDSMSTGIALAWATEAFEKGLIGEKETFEPLHFGELRGYLAALRHLSDGTNEFWRAVGKGTLHAAGIYGGADFACVLGQEMAGYATGEVFYVAQAMGFRHSHLDSGGYSYDQTNKEKDAEKAVRFLVDDERGRVMLTSLVSCLFARKVYSAERAREALSVLGYGPLGDNLDQAAGAMQALRWKLKLQTGFVPESVSIPKRFYEVNNWKGQADPAYIDALRAAYAKEIRIMGAL
ncbi:MAG: aldehyde ferredoxin oxidoreductase [Deltaproteobacteria bacterium]|jgi:aldehyde:ferredoxin oxidoreductase|nr:aldehyde ferredoxin oxidoreductase [Deltaproteobacteria bacterium]